jgi:hypothetical protein
MRYDVSKLSYRCITYHKVSVPKIHLLFRILDTAMLDTTAAKAMRMQRAKETMKLAKSYLMAHTALAIMPFE